ncbi:MAG: ATP-binding protein [Acidobacteria bacterium]|nr:ATP-binding protein [Acidobacteriota bacterium]MCY3964171.1 ATP-binding protein [Acidobacteriota bacterium]
MIDWFRKLAEARFRIATQLYVGIGGAAALTLAASLVALFAFAQVGDSQSRVNQGTVPELAAAFGVAQGSGTLVAAGPRLTAAADQDELERAVDEIEPAQRSFESALKELMTREAGSEEPIGGEAEIGNIQARGEELIGNITAIQESVSEGFELSSASEALRSELDGLQSQIAALLLPALDDQLFYAMTGFRSFDEPPAPRDIHFSEPEIDRYRVLVGLQQDITIVDQLLNSLAVLTDRPDIEPVEERYESSATSIERALSAIDETATSGRLKALFGETLAKSRDSFDLRRREVNALDRQQELLDQNRDLAARLSDDVESLVAASRSRSDVATVAASQAIRTGRALLIGLNVVSIAGAVFIAWLFVGRLLVRRFEALSSSMREMAGGNLEAEIGIGGADEVADMAAALEVFRRHALEVQRLNLVEKLADELKEKNDELEVVLADLQKAQDQIVMREKLAALGELTAGVAHEIKNPLNFVKNFSEVSGELLEEVEEIMKENEDGSLDEDQREEIAEIFEDLSGNLKLILSHGERANRIVNDMLKMGRGAAGREQADINRLVDEHIGLAYHSARATDPNFNLTIEKDFDPELGTLEVVSQDVGRVFLNLVSNACYATNERRQNSDDASYEPTLTVTTRKMDDGVEVRVRDNGNGIPRDVVDKIFNPFFTTKPTDQGTGLGLALSADIVREHGGMIRVDTEPGEYTEMIVELSAAPPDIDYPTP